MEEAARLGCMEAGGVGSSAPLGTSLSRHLHYEQEKDISLAHLRNKKFNFLETAISVNFQINDLKECPSRWNNGTHRCCSNAAQLSTIF